MELSQVTNTKMDGVHWELEADFFVQCLDQYLTLVGTQYIWINIWFPVVCGKTEGTKYKRHHRFCDWPFLKVNAELSFHESFHG